MPGRGGVVRDILEVDGLCFPVICGWGGQEGRRRSPSLPRMGLSEAPPRLRLARLEALQASKENDYPKSRGEAEPQGTQGAWLKGPGCARLAERSRPQLGHEPCLLPPSKEGPLGTVGVSPLRGVGLGQGPPATPALPPLTL